MRTEPCEAHNAEQQKALCGADRAVCMLISTPEARGGVRRHTAVSLTPISTAVMSIDTITIGAGHSNDRMRTWIQGVMDPDWQLAS